VKLYKCDLCKKTYVGKPKVETLGVAGHGGILLPEYLHSNEFCSPICFWAWCMKNNPFKDTDFNVIIYEDKPIEVEFA